MNRRDSILALIALGGMPLSGGAQRQSGKLVRLGILSPLSASAFATNNNAFRMGLRELGWNEGRNVDITTRYADGHYDRLPGLAAELVRLHADVIVCGSTAGALAAKNASTTTPIVMVTTGDPVLSGLVASLARPGGNLTGLTVLGRELSVKRLALLKEAFPGVARVAVVTNPDNPENLPMVKGLEAAAHSLGVQIRILEVRSPADMEKAFAAIAGEHLGAIMVLTDILFITHRERIAALAARSRLPAMYPFQENVDAGGLMFYGATLDHMWNRAAVYVDKVLGGAKPADLAVEQPTNFELVINLKTARALGLRIPQSLLLRADRVIEK
jgi:putative ABC transport system substrate-binding protein